MATVSRTRSSRRSTRPPTKKPAAKKAAVTLTATTRRELDDALALVAVSPKRAATAGHRLAQRLGPTREAILVYDSVADACLAVEPAWATAPFTSARVLERELGLPPALARYPAFAARGALDERELPELASHAGTDAVIITAVTAGVRATVDLVEALAVAPARRRGVLRAWLAAGLVTTIDDDVWLTAAEDTRTVLRADPSLAAATATALLARGTDADRELLAALELASALTPAQAIQLGEATLASDAGTPEALDAAAAIFAAIARVVDRPLVIERTVTDLRNRSLGDPARLELALAHGVPLALPRAPPESFAFTLWAWSRRARPEDELARVGTHPWFSRVLTASFAPHHGAAVGGFVRRALAAKGCGAVLDAFARWAEAIASSWTLGALDAHGAWLESVCLPEFVERVPSLADAVRALDPARLLANQLRAGLFDEWGWPAHDQASARFATPRRAAVSSGPFPFRALHEPGRLIVVGPDEIVLDRAYVHPADDGALRRVTWVDGDAIAVNWNEAQAHWVIAGGEPFSLAAPPCDLGGDGAVIGRDGATLRRGERTLATSPHARPGYRAWHDGVALYRVEQELTIGRHGDPEKIARVDPVTGAPAGHALPAWIAGLMTSDRHRLVVHLDVTHVWRVPPTAVSSPLGARDGLGGFAVIARGGDLVGEGIDERRGPGQCNGLFVAGLMTFPERHGLYPIVEAAFDLGVTLPDGTTPLVPTGKLGDPMYRGGTSGLTDLASFYLLRPRDLAGSRALATCSDEAARVLLDAAATPEVPAEQVTDYGNLQAVLVAAPGDVSTTLAFQAALARVLPAVTHPRLIAGIAGAAALARRLEATCARLAGQLAATSAARSTLSNAGGRALAVLLDHEMPWWIEKLGTQLGQQMLDVAAFLFGDAPGPVTPARTVLPWELVLERLGEILYRLHAPGTPRRVRTELRRVLEVWTTTPFATDPARVRLVSFALPLPAPELAGLDREHPDRLLAWDNRYFVRSAGVQHGHAVVRGIEATRDGVFRLPPGAQLVEERPVDRRFTRASILRAFTLLDERGPFALDRAAVAGIAGATGLSVAAATLVAAAAYEPWLAGTALLETLDLTRDDLARAELELRGKRLRELYVDAMPDRLEDLHDGPVVATRLARAWNARFGQAAPLPVLLIEALRTDLADAKLPLEHDARALIEPDRADVLTRDATWVMRPAASFDAGNRRFNGVLPEGWPLPAGATGDAARADADVRFHGYALSRFVRYLAWAHLSLPGGDAARAGAARIATLLQARLAHPDLLVLAALVDLTSYDNGAFRTRPMPDAAARFAALRDRFAGRPYVAADGGPSAAGTDRGDTVVTWPASENGLFIAFRPRALADDVALARFLDDVGARTAYERTHGATPIRVAFDGVPATSIICPPSFGHWLAWRGPAFQRLVAALSDPLPAGRYASDPRVSAPDAVARTRAAHDLDEAAATVRLQELVLGGADRARLLRINGWRAPDLDRAHRTLAARGLPSPDPRALHGLSPTDEPTFGVLLPLRPLAELFDAASRR